MEENSSRKWLYDKFVSKGLNVGKDYAQFDSLMTNNEESRKWVYSKARQMGLNVGKDYAQFDSIINPVVPPKEGVEADRANEASEGDNGAKGVKADEGDRANIAETTEIPKPTELNVADVATEADIEENRVFRDNFERELGVDSNYLEFGKQVADDLIDQSQKYPTEARFKTQQTIAEDVKKAFDEEQRRGAEEAHNILKKPLNGGFVPAHSGIGYGIIKSGEVAKATDIEPMINRVMENIIADETKVEEAMKPYLDAGYSETEAIQAASDDLASGIQRTIFDEYKKQNAPKDVTSYILGSVFRNNIVSQLAQGLARVSGGASGLNEQIKDEVYAEAGEQAGMLPRVAAGVGTLIADAPVFGGLGSVSANVAKGITEFGSKQFAKRIIGASGKAGIDAGSRYVGSSLTGRMVQGALASGGTLGSYDALAEMSRQMRTGVGEVSDIAGQFGHGFLMGAALAPIGVGSRYLSRNMSKTGKMMMDAGAFVAEAELFNLPNVIENPLDFAAHAEGFVESAATLGLMKGSHKLPKLATSEGRKSLRDEIKARYNSPDYINKARFTKEELAELKEQGYDLKELFKSDEASRSNGDKGINGVNGALVERGVEEVDVETVRKGEDRGDVELLENYVKMMRDPNVPMELKAKMAYRVEGRITANMPRATWVELKQNDNRYIVTTHDAMGNPISRKTFGGKREAENLYKEMEQVCESNSINIIEEITDRRSEERAITKALLDMGVQSSAEAQSIMSRIGEIRNKKASERTDEENNYLSSYEIRVKHYQITEESSAGIRAGIERESGLRIADILQKPANKRTLDEVATLAKYRRELMRGAGFSTANEPPVEINSDYRRNESDRSNAEKGIKGENEDETNRGNVGGEESESIKVAETTEIPKPTELNVATEADKVRKERSFNIEKLRGKAASIDDVLNLYGNSLGGRDYIMTYPEDYAEVIDRLETEREMAIAWSKGEPAVEKPDNWEYWKERDGLSEPQTLGSAESNEAERTKTNRGVTLPDGSDVTSIVRDSSKLSERIMSQYVDAPREVRDIIEPITDMREPLDVEDIVYERLSSLRSPNTRHKLVLNSVGGVKGVSDELGLPAKELQRMLGFNAFALPANGGISLQKMAESIAADINDGVYAGISNADEGEVRDMLIEAIRSAGEPADISYHRARRRIALAQSVYDDYVREVRAEEERYAAEEDAYNAYIENWLVEAEKGYNELPKNYFENIFADEERLRQEEYEQRNIDAGNQSGSKVLLGERLSERGRTEEGKDGQGLRGTVGEDMSRGANAVAQSREAGGVAEREVGAERQLGVEADRANEPSLRDVVRTLYSKGKEVASKLFSMKFFDVAQTPKFMQELGLRGDKFTIRYGVIARHFGKDSEHTLPQEIWEQLPEALLHPFAITKYYEDEKKQKQKGYRLYTALQLANGSYVVVSAEVKNVGREIEVNAINTIFGRSSLSDVHDELIYTSETITPDQQSLLNGNNPHQYTAERELSSETILTDANRTETTLISDLNEVSVGKDTVNSVKVNDLGVENDVLSVQEQVKAAESEVNTNPTEAQKEAGNYKKGHVQIGKFNITIEQPKGSVRRGVDANGNKWESEMQNTYGYIRGTEGVDGDHIDVFLSEDIDGWNGKQVFVVDQYNEDGSFDEHKVMLGFNEATEAHKAYLSNYSKDWSSKHKNIVTSVSIENFEKWIDSSHRKTKAFSEYKSAERQLGVRKEELGVGAEGVRERVAEWGGRIGAKVRVIERPEEIDNFPARRAIDEGLNISGWYDVNSGDVCIYAPNVRDVREVDRTIVHEVVSHKGLRGMLGEKAFNKLCDKTWDMMSEAERAEYESYPGVENIEDDEKRRRAAADEYISHLAEGVDLSEAERSTWRKVMDTIMDFLKKLYSDIKLTEKDLEEIIKASYRRLRVEAEKGDKGIKGVKGSDVEGVKPIGRGVFGNIYNQFRGKAKEAVQFLLNRKEGEAIGALHHPEVGDIDLVWGKEGTGKSDGFGLAKLAKYHPEVLDNIQEILDDMHVTQRTVNRVQMESDTHQAAVRLTWDNEQKNWLLTAFEKRNSVFDNTTDTAETSKQGKRNDTTTSQSTVSVGKDTVNSVKVNDLGEKNRSERLSRMPKPPYSIGQIQVAEGRGESELVEKMWKATQVYIEKKLTSEWIPEIENTIKELNNVTMGSDLKVNKSSVGYKYQQLLKNRLRELTKGDKANEAKTSRFRVDSILGNERIFEGLRKLEDGETSYVERKFSENKNFEFNSKNFIKGYDDVAYIFKQLENESVENAFAVLVKKGRPTVIHLGMGNFTQTMVNKSGLNVAVNRIKPDKIYFVHNHPSGVLKSSEQDHAMLDELVLSYGSDVVQYGIIINSFTGKYGIFSSHIEGMSYDMPKEQPGERPIKVYSFNKMVYDKNYQPTTTLRSGSDVAAFITSQRLGDRQKLGLLVVDNQLRITGNVFLPYSEFTHENADKIANDIAYYTAVMGGTRAFLFGNTSMSKLSDKNLSSRVRSYTGGQIQMLDYVEIAGGRYKSAYEEGTMFRFIGEKGAGALDRADEASVRLDNLTVAREMERNFEEKKSRIEKLRSSKPIEITGNEIEKSEDIKTYRENAKKHGFALRGEYKNTDTGNVISLSKGSIKEVTSHDVSNEQMQSIAAIPQIIEKSIYIDTIENADKSKHPDVVSYDYYVCGLKIGYEDYTVKAVVANSTTGERYYDHKLTQIEKGKLISLTTGITNPGNENNSPLSQVKDKRLLSILQVNDKENAKRIKFATGWERGADGKWRYEVSDGKFDVRGELHPERRRLSKEEQLELDNAFDELMDAFEKGSLAYDKEITEDTDMADIYVAGGMPRERAERLLSLEDKEKKLKKSKKHLDDYLDDESLYAAYPELREIKIVEGDPMLSLTGQLGGYNPRTKTLTLYDLSKDTLLHEVQHSIQHIEGFARGGSAKDVSEARRLNNRMQREVESLLNQLDINEWLSREDIQDVILRNQKEGRYFNLGYAFSESLGEITGYALRQKLDEANRAIAENNRMIGGSSNLSPIEHYRRLGGEVEARNVARRMGMSIEERRNSLAEETEDVSRGDQIFIMDGLGSSESAEKGLKGEKVNEDFYFTKGYVDSSVNAKRAVESYKRNFKALDRPAIDIINSLEDLYDYALRVGADAEDAEEFAEYVKSKKTVGSYSSEIDRIIIFAWRGGNPYLTTFHENVHRAVTRHGGAGKFPNLVSELKVFDPRLLRRINKTYNPEEVDDEIIAYTLEAALAGNAIKELQGYLSETAYEELDKILNYIGYDEGRNSESDAERFVTEENSGEFERVRRWTRGAIERRGRGGRRLELGGLPSRKREQYENSTKDSVSEEKQERVEVGAGKAKEDLYLTKSSQIADKDIRFREREEEERERIVLRAKADGTYMKAPNGKPSMLNERQWVEVRTKAFKNWFGDWENSSEDEDVSKIVDENGEPMVATHGTPAYFNTFEEAQQGKNDAGWLGKGFYFYTKNRDYSNGYARGGRVMDVYLNIRNPYYASIEEYNRLAEADNRIISEEFTAELIAEGYDGVYYDGDLNGETVAFYPNQIKSATDNVGTFNGSEEDIRFREREDEEREVIGELGGGVPWGDGETLADAMSRVRRKRNRLVIDIDNMERRREAGKPIDERAYDDAKAELAQAEKELRYMEIGPEKPELAEGESETDASYVAKMEQWREQLLEWKGKKYDEDEYMDSFLRNATGERADMSDEELHKLLESEKDKRNTSIKEMKKLIKEQIRERRRNIEVSNWEDEVTIKNIKDKTTQEERELIPHILEGSYSILPSKDKRYAEYLNELKVRNEELGIEFEELEEYDTRRVENSNYNARATSNSAGLRNSDIVEYAFDSGNATFYVSIDGNRALLKMSNGDVYPLNVYDIRYLYWLYDRLPIEDRPRIELYGMGTDQEQMLGMFLRGEAEWILPKGIREYKEGKEYDAGLLATVKEIRDWYDEAWEILNREGMTYGKESIDRYVTHIWDLRKSTPHAIETLEKFMVANEPTAVKDIDNYISTNTPYMRTRAIASILDGMEFGLVPKYKDITDIMRDYGHRMNEAVENRRLVNFVKGLRVNGMDAIREAGKHNDGVYVLIDNNALRGYEVHRDVKPVLDIVFGKLHTTDNVILQNIGHYYDVLGGILKKLNLSLSFFHHGALTETAVSMMNPWQAGKTIFKNIMWDAAFKGHIPAFNDVELTRDAVKHFVQLGATQDYAAKDIKDLTTRLADWAEGKPGVEELATIVDFWNKGMDTFLWEYLHDGYKVYGYGKLAGEIRAKSLKEGWSAETLEKALDEAGQLINDTYGGQHWDLLGWSPNTVRWARRALLSPDWTLSTLRQALAPFGLGQLYNDDKFWKKWFKNDPVSRTRKKYGRAFWLTAALVFIPLMNGLNAYFRMKDEEEERLKAEEERKTKPDYKSPYELVYPDGMKWWDYTMLGNTIGHQTHLFGGRYEDGKEMYVRWGKQFRELPELFIGRDGVSFPQPMIDKIAGKLNPTINMVTNLTSGYSLTGFQNSYMKNKRGWERELARVYVLVSSFLPYSIPTDEEKEFKLSDLTMPSTKGFSAWKAIDKFKVAIASGDVNFVGQVYDACVMNGLDAEVLLDVAMKQIEVAAKKEMIEGVEDVNDAINQYDSESNPVRRMQLKRYILKQMSAQDYKYISREEALEEAEAFIESGVTEKNMSDYDAISTSEDLIEDWRLRKAKAGLKPYWDEYRKLREEDSGAAIEYYKRNMEYIEKYREFNRIQRRISKYKKDLGKGKDEEVMGRIRKERKGALGEI